jgi:VWFA-related protein
VAWLFSRPSSRRGQSYAAARQQLQAVAEQTGGLMFKARQAEDLKGVYQRVAAELHLLYSLAYDAKNAQKDGQFRRVSVKVNRDGSSARTRRGYYAR